MKISADEARRIALAAAGLSRPAARGLTRRPAALRRAAVRDMLGGLGSVQLDTISVLARSHELVAYARLSAVGRGTVEQAYWDGTSAFEYWSHAACLLPMELWPLFAFRRRAFAAQGKRWHDTTPTAVDTVVERLRRDGPMTATELGGARTTSGAGGWWSWSEAKIAVEFALDLGRVICTRREGWRRVYDLPERALPQHILDRDELVDGTCIEALVAASIRTLGVATVKDLADVHRLTTAQVTRVIPALIDQGALVGVVVQGWPDVPTFASPAALESLTAGDGEGRTTLLSPFDPLVWDRPRTRRIFGLEHRLEAYMPAHKRQHGYFAMPVLHRGHLIARVDPARAGRTLVAKRVTVETGPRDRVARDSISGTARALREAATWVGAEAISLVEVRPESARVALMRTLA